MSKSYARFHISPSCRLWDSFTVSGCGLSLTFRAVFVCFPAQYLSVYLFCQTEMLCFSIFLFSPLLHSVLSFTVYWALYEDSVSRRLTVVCVCVNVYTQRYDWVYILGDGDIALFVCFFFLTVCVFCYLGKLWRDTHEGWGLVAEVWRSLSPPSLHHIHLPQKQKYSFIN